LHVILKIIWCALFSMAGSASAADPFSWELAEVNLGRIAFEDGTEVRYRVGHIYVGNYVDVSVVIDNPPFGPSETDTVLYEAVNLGIPKIRVDGGLFVAEETGTLWGQYEPTTHLRCWRPDGVFVEVKCPASLLP